MEVSPLTQSLRRENNRLFTPSQGRIGHVQLKGTEDKHCVTPSAHG
jgi:hypothetical protein